VRLRCPRRLRRGRRSSTAAAVFELRGCEKLRVSGVQPCFARREHVGVPSGRFDELLLAQGRPQPFHPLQSLSFGQVRNSRTLTRVIVTGTDAALKHGHVANHRLTRCGESSFARGAQTSTRGACATQACRRRRQQDFICVERRNLRLNFPALEQSLVRSNHCLRGPAPRQRDDRGRRLQIVRHSGESHRRAVRQRVTGLTIGNTGTVRVRASFFADDRLRSCRCLSSLLCPAGSPKRSTRIF